jgi:hypothetical protein
MRISAQTGLLASLILWGSVAEGVPITFQFSGVIDAVYDPTRYGDAIMVGDAYSAAFIIDSTTPNQDQYNQHGGLYLPLSATLTVGQVTFAGVQNDRQGLRVQAQTSPAAMSLWSECSSSPDVGLLVLGGTFVDWTGGAPSSPAIPLPGTAPALSAFQDVYFDGTDSLTKLVQFHGTVTSLEVTPEPGTLTLMLFGITCVWTRRTARI